jgi:hypothetical protein
MAAWLVVSGQRAAWNSSLASALVLFWPFCSSICFLILNLPGNLVPVGCQQNVSPRHHRAMAGCHLNEMSLESQRCRWKSPLAKGVNQYCNLLSLSHLAVKLATRYWLLWGLAVRCKNHLQKRGSTHLMMFGTQPPTMFNPNHMVMQLEQ